MGNVGAGDFVQFIPPFSATSAPAITITNAGEVGVASDAAYVAATSQSSNSILIFTQPLTASSVPSATMTNTGSAELAAFDASGDLWVATNAGSSISEVNEFKPPFTNAQGPVLTVATDLANAVAVAFDGSSNLYVLNDGLVSGAPQLLVFAPPYSGTPTIQALPLGNPAEALGVAVYGNQLAIGVFSQSLGARPLGGSIVRRGISPWPAARHHVTGGLPPQAAGGGEILTYSLPITGSNSPTATIPQTEAEGVAFDASGTLYVGDADTPGATGGILVFDEPLTNASTYSFAIVTGINGPAGLNFGL